MLHNRKPLNEVLYGFAPSEVQQSGIEKIHKREIELLRSMIELTLNTGKIQSCSAGKVG